MKQCPQEKLPENGKKAVGFPKPHFKPSVSAASGTQCCMQALTACGIETWTITGLLIVTSAVLHAGSYRLRY